ncbi:MAG TPA: GntR family transcriptional regulator [Segeticoccus sp.]|uniref:GntR family transcriptional regulator n=1 Tax=Segeticoccus sp. TaxID=2706531 RepID=UPI002D7F90FE|nr:GntR family transcriptional regulator [Segeticoccus sp.]HET8600412.1 GntR family transcriptional regulator [Segeticoccus sp.]
MNDSPDRPPYELLPKFLPGGVLRGRTTEAITDALREAILDGLMPPSAWLREDELAAAFKVSRTPVREALRRLSDEGLAVKTTNHGTVVAPLSLEDILALYVVRENLEGLTARLAAGHPSVALVKSLDEIGTRMEEAAEAADVPALSKLNLEWHRALRHGAGNTYLDRFLGQVEHAVRRLPKSTLNHPGRPCEVIQEHDGVVRAIEAGDAETAERLARAHMRRAREIRIAVLLGG